MKKLLLYIRDFIAIATFGTAYIYVLYLAYPK